MCGIAGCVGHPEAINFVTRGLERMEYRGYDSAGVAYPSIELPRIEVVRAVGKLTNLLDIIPDEASLATAAIGHTRWATHGSPKALENAHPHSNKDQTIV